MKTGPDAWKPLFSRVCKLNRRVEEQFDFLSHHGLANI
jgi:hypothetical protein